MDRGGYSGRDGGGHRGGRGGFGGRRGGGKGGSDGGGGYRGGRSVSGSGNQQHHHGGRDQQSYQHHHGGRRGAGASSNQHNEQQQYQQYSQHKQQQQPQQYQPHHHQRYKNQGPSISQGGAQWAQSQPPVQAGPSLGGGAAGGVGPTRGGYSGGGRGRSDRSGVDQSPRASIPESVPGSVFPDMQSLKLSEQLPSSSSLPENTDKIVPVRRPDTGGTLAIRTAKLRVNHFSVEFSPESIILHYDVDINEDALPKNGRPRKISKSVLSMIKTKLFTDNPTQFPLSMTTYDGEKNIFSAVPLPTGEFKVKVSEAEDMKSRTYTFSVKLVNELKLCKLKDYLTGKLFSIPRDVLQGMDVVMKENPNRRMISVGRSFYPAESFREDDLGYGITASRGYQHSLRPTSQCLALCLDYSVLAFRKRLPVIDYLKQHIHGFNLKDFEKFICNVEDALRKLKVNVTHRITQQKYTIAGLTKERTRDILFDLNDPDGNAPPRQVSLINYFKEKYDRDIKHKDIPCLDVGNNKRTNYVPMEFCVLVEGQIYPKEQLDRNAALMLKNMSLAKPDEREGRICKMVRGEDGPCGGDDARNFGIEVNRNMTSVTGRVIKPPELKVGAVNGGKVIQITVEKDFKCQWNLVGKGLVEGKAVDRWAVLDFSSSDRFNSLNPSQFIPKLINRCKSLGMRMAEPLLYECTTMKKLSNIDVLRQLLECICTKAYKVGGDHLQILVCVMSKKDNGYKYLKWISETKIGVMTQCCLSPLANKGQDQYLANLALKINAKLGGSNVELIDPLPYFEREDRVMFVGADVNHPATMNKESPSIAAVVATINWPAANRYAARVHNQDHRKEKIMDFGTMCWELVETYDRLNGVRPGKIVIFRDGVSEGQFDMVLNEELLDLKMAFEKFGYSPTITVIVAQKRHHTRLFQESGRDVGPVGNVSPGTVVDTKIVHPFEFDFYLCSHYGSLGTSKPTHYHVLWDEHGFSSDQLQKLIYNLCFTFARCTKPVSLVPPVYYADLVAYRGRLYHEAVIEGQNPSSSSTLISSSSGASLDERFYKLHADLENDMFFV